VYNKPVNHKTLIITTLLGLTNIVSVFYYRQQIDELRQGSEFVIFGDKKYLPTGSDSLITCLRKSKIESKTEDGSVNIRLVDKDKAIARCS
jgi:hypothetical protein